jgi:hypothetical protein
VTSAALQRSFAARMAVLVQTSVATGTARSRRAPVPPLLTGADGRVTTEGMR